MCLQAMRLRSPGKATDQVFELLVWRILAQPVLGTGVQPVERWDPAVPARYDRPYSGPL